MRMSLARQMGRSLAELHDTVSADEVDLWALLMRVEEDEAVKAAEKKPRGQDGRGFESGRG